MKILKSIIDNIFDIYKQQTSFNKQNNYNNPNNYSKEKNNQTKNRSKSRKRTNSKWESKLFKRSWNIKCYKSNSNLKKMTNSQLQEMIKALENEYKKEKESSYNIFQQEMGHLRKLKQFHSERDKVMKSTKNISSIKKEIDDIKMERDLKKRLINNNRDYQINNLYNPHSYKSRIKIDSFHTKATLERKKIDNYYNKKLNYLNKKLEERKGFEQPFNSQKKFKSLAEVNYQIEKLKNIYNTYKQTIFQQHDKFLNLIHCELRNRKKGQTNFDKTPIISKNKLKEYKILLSKIDYFVVDTNTWYENNEQHLENLKKILISLNLKIKIPPQVFLEMKHHRDCNDKKQAFLGRRAIRRLDEFQGIDLIDTPGLTKDFLDRNYVKTLERYADIKIIEMIENDSDKSIIVLAYDKEFKIIGRSYLKKRKKVLFIDLENFYDFSNFESLLKKRGLI